MDTLGTTAKKIGLDLKRDMPRVYESIEARASRYGQQIWHLVEDGLKGRQNCFWAWERGMELGTPFNVASLDVDTNAGHAPVGQAFAVIWPLRQVFDEGRHHASIST